MPSSGSSPHLSPSVLQVLPPRPEALQPPSLKTQRPQDLGSTTQHLAECWSQARRPSGQSPPGFRAGSMQTRSCGCSVLILGPRASVGRLSELRCYKMRTMTLSLQGCLEVTRGYYACSKCTDPSCNHCLSTCCVPR